VKIYADEQYEVHEGDTVRYVRWNWSLLREDNKFFRKTGTVTDVQRNRPDSVGVHFPHYAKGANILVIAREIRLVHCPHGKEG